MKIFSDFSTLGLLEKESKINFVAFFAAIFVAANFWDEFWKNWKFSRITIAW